MILLLTIISHTYAQSNKGTEFWTAWMNHIDGTGSVMNLYLTSDVNTNATVSLADNTFSQTYAITANNVTVVNIPTSAYLPNEGQVLKGIHITSEKNIVVYAHIYHMSRSGATLVLPVNAMGKDYYSINYTQNTVPGNNGIPGYSTFCVIATENNTTVEITPTAALLSGKPANTTFTVTLQKGELYQALSNTDLTGTHIKSVSNGNQGCKKIAVYSGSSWDRIACNNKSSADNLFQQVYPTATWGKNFVTAPLASRHYDIFRIIYSDPTANVQLNGTAINSSQLVNNLYYEFPSTAPNVITSDKPIQVVQYAVTQGATQNCTTINNDTDVGDPEMIFLSPIEQGLDHVTLYTTKNESITQSYINVIIPGSAASSFILDGASYTNFTAINGSYSYAQIKVAAGTHNISASAPFSAIAYGFGNVESYGYAAGTDLKNLNEFIVLENKTTNTAAANGCIGVTYTPQITLPYQTNSITWDLQDGTPPFTDANPTITSTTTKDGVTLNTYTSSKTAIYTTAGNYHITAIVFNPVADDCGSNEEVDIDFTVSDIPATQFNLPTSACLNDEVNFTDQTDSKGITVKSWAWDFGDAANATAANPNTATTQNAKHTYTIAGDYTVTLTVTNSNGCAITAQHNIHINALPMASFTVSTPDCETRAITFTDTSLPGDGTNTTWVWDFGDGAAPVTKTNNTPFTYQYATAGTYNVTLTVTASTGCVSTVFTRAVIISPLPQVDFTLPDVCLSDAFAQFNDKTTIADNSETQFTYLWNFGDPNFTLANPNTSTLKNPKHKYTQVRDASNPYVVTLTVTSNNGCAVTKSQSFTVNGDTPKAVFSIENPNNLCSSEDVIFDDLSTVNFGNITKLVWYFDYANHPTDATVYTKDQFSTDRKYHHNYGLFYTPASQNYSVRLEAYSGTSCVNVSGTQTITVKANPSVTLSQIGTICQDAGPIQITQTVNNGYTGTGTFSGPGVTTTGLFDPLVSGNGNFTINYTFAANNGCNYNASQVVTVNPVPKVNAGSDVHVLEGGGITINATATGVQPLTYKWTLTDGSTATGLNHDDILTPVASPANDVTYMLTVTSAEGCTASSTVKVFVLKAPEIPTAFTPNTDGVNDTWNIKYLDTYPNCTVDIYNRYGEKLYSSIGYPIPWDGTFNGKLLPTGTYYYVINPKNGRQIMSGSIAIIR